MTDPLSFVVLGKPQPAGSKKAFAVRRGGELTGRVAVVDDAKHSRSWKHDVAVVARQEMGGQPLMEGPLVVEMRFAFQRPKSHYGTGRNSAKLKVSAPRRPTGPPDALKLARAAEDSMTSIVYRDDAQTVRLTVEKVYGQPEGCAITVRRLDAVAEEFDQIRKAAA